MRARCINPIVGTTSPRLRRREIRPQSITDTRRVLEAADEDALLRVLTTGARRGEVCGIRWSDNDGGARTLSIIRVIASVAGGTIVKETKTNASRTIALDDATVAILDAQRERMQHRANTCEVELLEDGDVFTSTAGGLPVRTVSGLARTSAHRSRIEPRAHITRLPTPDSERPMRGAVSCAARTHRCRSRTMIGNDECEGETGLSSLIGDTGGDRHETSSGRR